MNSIIFIIVIVALFIVPFFVFGGGAKGKIKKALTASLIELAKKNSCTISQTEFWNHNIMGLSKDGNKLLFATSSENLKKETVVDLNTVKLSRVNITSRSGEGKASNLRVIEKITLVLEPNNGNSPTIELRIYDSEVDGIVLGNELQIAEKWAVMTNEQIAASNR